MTTITGRGEAAGSKYVDWKINIIYAQLQRKFCDKDTPNERTRMLEELSLLISFGLKKAGLKFKRNDEGKRKQAEAIANVINVIYNRGDTVDQLRKGIENMTDNDGNVSGKAIKTLEALFKHPFVAGNSGTCSNTGQTPPGSPASCSAGLVAAQLNATPVDYVSSHAAGHRRWRSLETPNIPGTTCQLGSGDGLHQCTACGGVGGVHLPMPWAAATRTAAILGAGMQSAVAHVPSTSSAVRPRGAGIAHVGPYLPQNDVYSALDVHTRVAQSPSLERSSQADASDRVGSAWNENQPQHAPPAPTRGTRNIPDRGPLSAAVASLFFVFLMVFLGMKTT